MVDNITVEHLPKTVFTEDFENGLSSNWEINRQNMAILWQP